MKKKMALKTKIVVAVSVIAAIGAIAVLVLILLGAGSKTEPSPNDDQNNVTNNRTDEEITSFDKAIKHLSLSGDNQKVLKFIFTELDGYWACGSDMFMGFATEDGEHLAKYGLLATSFGVDGKVTGVKTTGTNVFALDLLVFARPETEISGATPEHVETVYVDVSTYGQDGQISLKLENIGENDWHTYKYASKTEAEFFGY